MMHYKIKEDYFSIIGIGASAGGLAAFEDFFAGLENHIDTNMAFVLIQHLSPDHTSMLVELVQRYTKMKVAEVKDGMRIKPNCVYISPPAHNMSLDKGCFKLIAFDTLHGQHLPIDFFFHSLAENLQERSIGIILSGTASDGTQGISAIKQAGGMVIVQDPQTTQYNGMPNSAIATGLVDYILSPDQMPHQLIRYISLNLSKSEFDFNPKELDKIFALLRTHTGHDFSKYKPSTIGRRIQRRLSLHQIESVLQYINYLQENPKELDALFHDLLIGVTSFFRDGEAFLFLQEQIIPKLLALKSPSDTLRVWCVGCSSGEEPYSIAMLIKEQMDVLAISIPIQIFATDIDSQAIEIARKGNYPATISANISAKRLEHFFTFQADGTYQIHKDIRDMLIFSEQNIIKDPPFSKVDLISCRNLLIYINSELQKKIIPLFHYALNPKGFLFLGSSESIGEHGNLFHPVDQKLKIFQRQEHVSSSTHNFLDRLVPSMGITRTTTTREIQKAPLSHKLPLRELMEQSLLHQLPLSGVIVNEEGDILYLHGKTGDYLELPTGEVGVYNILNTAREGLRRDLTLALHKAVVSHESVRYELLHVENLGIKFTLNLSVLPLPRTALLENKLYVIIFQEVQTQVEHSDATLQAHSIKTDESKQIKKLQQELFEQEAFLQLANKKLESSNEELTFYNEEMQSLNEELQSTNEELETSKEELQSLNEELSTVNTELQIKVADLTRANNDMNNLLAGTNIGTIFVDLKLCILRFTPAATKIINLITSDLGRPIAHIVTNLVQYETFIDDIQAVLDTLIPKELEVHTGFDKWYSMRIAPYRTIDNVIEGAVISFIDISEIVHIRHELKVANEKAKANNEL